MLSLVLLISVVFPFCFGQEELRGYINVSDSSKVKVVLNCGPRYMTVQLLFNQTLSPTFFDWIVVGSTNKNECKLQGNGQIKYIVDIPVINDPCGTKMISAGSFENEIRIGQNPAIILKGDEIVRVKCLYGPPEVVPPFTLPTLPPNIPSIGVTDSASRNDLRDSRPVRAGLAVGYIYLIVFLILFLALLFLLCGCLYFFFKRRKLRLERRKKLVLAVPPGSELNKIGLGHTWWSGGKMNVSNDALLSHDYMMSSNSTREGGLSVSTDYAGDSPSTSSGGSPGHQGAVNPRLVHKDWKSQLPKGVIYAHVDKKKRDLDLDSVKMGNNGSVSTLEGEGSSDAPPLTVAADVHAAALHEEFIRVVEQNPGVGSKRLNDADLARWRHLVETDPGLRELLRSGRTPEQHPHYRNLFPSEKWAQIVASLSQANFIRRLNQIIDHPQHDEDFEDGLEAPSGKRRYLKKSDGQPPRPLTSAEILTVETLPEERMFTRDSYYRVKDSVGSDDDTSIDLRPMRPPEDYTSEMATTEFVEGAPTVRAPQEQGEIHRARRVNYVDSNNEGTLDTGGTHHPGLPPTLNVYVGNVPDRAIPARPNHYESHNSVPSYDTWQDDPEHL